MSSISKYQDTNISFSGCDMVVTIDIIIPSVTGEQKKITKVIGSLQTLTYSIHMDKAPVRSIGSVNAKDYLFGPRTIAGSLIFAMFNRHFAHEILLEAKTAGSFAGQQMLMDELPAFNVTVTMANEYGATARFALYGVRIVNEGNVMSVNDVYTENTYQFVATDIEYLTDSTGSSSSGESNAASYAESKIVGVRNPAGAVPIPVPSEEAVDDSQDEKEVVATTDGNSLNITDLYLHEGNGLERT